MKKNCTLFVVPTPPNLSKETGLAPRFQGPSLLGDKGVTLSVQELWKSGRP